MRHGRLLILSADAAGAPDQGLLLLLVAAAMAGCTAVGAAAVLFVQRYRHHRGPQVL